MGLKTLSFMLIVFVWMRCVLRWQIFKSNPALSVLNVFKLLNNFFWSVTRLLNNFPECLKLLNWYLTITVYIDSLEKLSRGYLTKFSLPMFNSFVFVNKIGMIFIEQIKYFFYFFFSFLRKFLKLWFLKLTLPVPPIFLLISL